MPKIDIDNYIEQSGMRKARFGGYEPDDVRQAMRELCADYEQHLAAAAELRTVRQENDALRRHAQTLVMQNQNLSAQNATLAGQVDKLQSYRTNLETQYSTAKERNHSLTNQLDVLRLKNSDLVRENKELRAKVEQGIAEANRAMTVASSVMSPEMLQQALLYPKQSATLDMTFQNIMSVSVPVYEFHTKNEDAASIYPYGFAQTSGELDDALGALASVFQDMLALAQAEKKTQLLASEIEKTRRRVNALEYVMIPEMEKNIKYISMKLEENDRATKVRLMKVKDMVLKDAHEFED